MSSLAATNRPSDMWNNCADVNPQSALQAKQYGYRQYPTLPDGYSYQNNGYNFQNCDNVQAPPATAAYAAKMYGNRNQIDEQAVKPEPVSWQDHTNYANSNNYSNVDMINRWKEMNANLPYYKYHYENGYYAYDQRVDHMNQGYVDTKADDSRSITSPSQCSIPETNYGSPGSNTSNAKPASPEIEDSPNLRALLMKPKTRKSPSYLRNVKSYKQEAIQRLVSQRAKVSEWEKNNEAASDIQCNLSQFHGGLRGNGEDQNQKSGAVGGANGPEDEVAASSMKPCQEVTRVEAGGDNADSADYSDGKMAAVSDTNGIYPWMKTIGGMLR